MNPVFTRDVHTGRSDYCNVREVKKHIKLLKAKTAVAFHGLYYHSNQELKHTL